jgi:hypothetical protein
MGWGVPVCIACPYMVLFKKGSCWLNLPADFVMKIWEEGAVVAVAVGLHFGQR